MTDKVFVDTNILIYAHDLDAGKRHTAAQALVEALWQSGKGVVSLQVLQEFYVSITREIPAPLARHQARSLVETYLRGLGSRVARRRRPIAGFGDRKTLPAILLGRHDRIRRFQGWCRSPMDRRPYPRSDH